MSLAVLIQLLLCIIVVTIMVLDIIYYSLVKPSLLTLVCMFAILTIDSYLFFADENPNWQFGLMMILWSIVLYMSTYELLQRPPWMTVDDAAGPNPDVEKE